MENIFDIQDKIILVTGSSRGLGYSIAKGYAESKAKVILNSTNESTLNAAVEELKTISGNKNIFGYSFNVTDKEEVEKKISSIENSIGPIDVLVNNAGIQRRNPLEKMNLEEWTEVINTNLTSVFIVSQIVGKYMINRKHGKIINITSLNAEASRPTIANYSSAKGGLKMLTKSMACEWGKYNINTNAIGPGYFKTDLTEVLSQNPEFNSWVESEVPLSRWGKPEELIGAAIFLASSASNYVNGHTIYVDGGWQSSL